MTNYFDNVNFRMSPCTTLWGRSMDRLNEHIPTAKLTTRIIGPMAAFPLLVDAALHLGACALKALYSLVTGTWETISNAFRDRWIPCSPLMSYAWNRWESAKHFVAAIKCAVIGVAAIPTAFVAPTWTLDKIRQWHLARPPIPKPVIVAPKPPEPPKVEPVKKPLTIGQKIFKGVDSGLNSVERCVRRYPNTTYISGHIVYAATIGVSIAVGAKVIGAASNFVFGNI